MNRRPTRRFLFCLLSIVYVLAAATTVPVAAQTVTANQGAISFTGGLDAPSVYFFRGIRQEGDPSLTLWPYGDLRVALASGDGAIKQVAVHVGVWNSLHTGSSGTGGPLDKLHYQEDFSATFDLGLSRGFGVAASYVARTSPNGGFETIKEIDVKVSKRGRIAPYGILAFELSDKGQADGGSKRGTYLELGAAPSAGLPFAHARVSAPLKVGLSLRNYYELFGSDLTYRDRAFGFFGIGGLLTVPLRGVSPRYGAWDVHGGVDVLALGDTTRVFNRGDKTKVIGLVGIGLVY